MPRSDDLYAGSYAGRPRHALLKTSATIGLVFVAILGIFFGGEYLQRLYAYRQARADDPNLRAVSWMDPLRSIVLNARDLQPRPRARAALLETGLPVYDLRIAPDDLQVLQTLAEQVTARSVSTGFTREYVDAQFRHDGDWLRVQVKLRGLYDTHYLKTRPSLRLKFPGDRLFEGKKQINLSEIYDKGLTVDVTTDHELERHGILTWDSRFVVLRVNGSTVGLFQEIEQFGRSMADRSGRPEGYIFSGHGQLFGKEGFAWDKARAAMDRLLACRTPDGEPVSPECDWRFVSAYFDVERMAQASALKLVLGSEHAWYPDNLRLFWDPARGRFEPIPWDYGHSAIASGPEKMLAGYGRAFVGLPEFRRERDVRAWAVLNERVEPMIAHADGLFASLEEALRIDWRHPDIEQDRAQQQAFVDVLRANRDVLIERFSRYDAAAQAWRGPVRAVVSVENRAASFLLVEGWQARVGGRVVEGRLERPQIVDGAWADHAGRAVFAIDVPDAAREVVLQARNGVTGEPLPTDALRLATGSGAAPEPRIPDVPALPALPRGARLEAGAVVFGPGRVVLTRSLELPDGQRVSIAAGTELLLASGASLIVRGDLEAVGDPERPIVVRGLDGPNWGAIAVQGTRTRPANVALAHLALHGGTGADTLRAPFTGAFSVHDGVVQMRSVTFIDGRSDDGVNLKYARIDVEDVLLRGSRDDAFDCDFCRGRVVGSRVEDSGGDGIDFSGSDVEVRNNVMIRCADKGLSIGENTKARLSGNVVRDSYAGVAVKDLSEAEIRDMTLEGLEIGIALYVKKPTFGPSVARVGKVRMERVATPTLLDTGCRIEALDGSAG